MRLDSKSARRIATGQLNTALTDARASSDKVHELVLTAKSIPHAKPSARMQTLMNTNRASYGDFLIGDFWDNRTYTMLLFDVAESESPMRLSLLYETFNTRSGHRRSFCLATITMHAMERLMERRENTALLAVAREEFDLAFVHQLIGFGKKQTDIWAGHEARLVTRNGWACGVFDPALHTFVVKTWIHEPGGHVKTSSASAYNPRRVVQSACASLV